MNANAAELIDLCDSDEDNTSSRRSCQCPVAQCPFSCKNYYEDMEGHVAGIHLKYFSWLCSVQGCNNCFASKRQLMVHSSVEDHQQTQGFQRSVIWEQELNLKQLMSMFQASPLTQRRNISETGGAQMQLRPPGLVPLTGVGHSAPALVFDKDKPVKQEPTENVTENYATGCKVPKQETESSKDHSLSCSSEENSFRQTSTPSNSSVGRRSQLPSPKMPPVTDSARQTRGYDQSDQPTKSGTQNKSSCRFCRQEIIRVDNNCSFRKHVMKHIPDSVKNSLNREELAVVVNGKIRECFPEDSTQDTSSESTTKKRHPKRVRERTPGEKESDEVPRKKKVVVEGKRPDLFLCGICGDEKTSNVLRQHVYSHMAEAGFPRFQCTVEKCAFRTTVENGIVAHVASHNQLDKKSEYIKDNTSDLGEKFEEFAGKCFPEKQEFLLTRQLVIAAGKSRKSRQISEKVVSKSAATEEKRCKKCGQRCKKAYLSDHVYGHLESEEQLSRYECLVCPVKHHRGMDFAHHLKKHGKTMNDSSRGHFFSDNSKKLQKEFESMKEKCFSQESSGNNLVNGTAGQVECRLCRVAVNNPRQHVRQYHHPLGCQQCEFHCDDDVDVQKHRMANPDHKVLYRSMDERMMLCGFDHF